MNRRSFFKRLVFVPLSGFLSKWAKIKGREREQGHALWFVQMLLDAPIPRIALENPVSVISTKIRKPDQIVQPWWFGHGEVKATCLWLKGLPLLEPTDIVDVGMFQKHKNQAQENANIVREALASERGG